MLDVVFNRALDLSMLIHIPVKLFSMYIVFFHSPNEMGALPFFILNVMFWNFLGNVLGATLHVNPQFPSSCFQADGPISVITDDPHVHHLFFGGIFGCVLNCALALSLAFPYRYLVFVFPGLVKGTNMRYGACLCAGIHLLYTVVYAFIYSQFMLVDTTEPDLSAEDRFCHWSHGWHKNIFFIGFSTAIVISLATMSAFSLLLRYSLQNMTCFLSKSTLEVHRKFLLYLLINTAVPLAFGGFPTMIFLFCAYYPHIVFAREISLLCIFIMVNHGAVYSLVTLVTFKPYNYAARRAILHLLLPKPSTVHHMVISSPRG
uniref:G protein-coupled receptor n=1 Tax=Steinernema glaseri TaxID=37863 RepID=A0A1I7Y219_9BILA